MTAGRSQKSKNTEPEIALLRALRGVGLYGYRLHHRIELPRWKNKPQHTTPDVAFVSHKVAVYADGCYWHSCALHGMKETKTNAAEWRQKRALIRARDERHSRYLSVAGWRVVRVWECEDPKEAAKAVKAVIDAEAPPGVYGTPAQGEKR